MITLPGDDLLAYRGGDGGNQIARDIDPVELAHVPLDIPGAHAAGVEGDDLVVESGKAPPVFADQRRTETVMPVARNRQLERAIGGENRL